MVATAEKRCTSMEVTRSRSSITSTREETVAVQSGRLLFEVGDDPEGPLESFELLPREAVHLVPGTRHRMTALEDTVILEASTTELEDVVRLEDRYGRM
jgi:mannose-6-phosphate isomerase